MRMSCDLSLEHSSELRGSDVYLHIAKNRSGNFSLHSARVRALGPGLEFFQDFSNFLKEVSGANHL